MTLWSYVPLVLWSVTTSASACELCAIYGAASAPGEYGKGLVLIASDEYISSHNLQYNGTHLAVPDPEFLDSSLTHVVIGYNFNPQFNLSLSVPVIYHSFIRSGLVEGPNGVVGFEERGAEAGLGDMALIGRWTAFRYVDRTRSVQLDLLGGVKLPTGNTDRLKQELYEAKIIDSFYVPGEEHDPLHASGVHSHDLA